ncbi:transglycosylase SLT domain-containing protein [Streptomyces sp. NPDC059740]|uniref:transglycosylase SLT domain-containing protein n=1 Tax=Streptomyces sp. NPDC059740 TaxID=3346926 RepID=UPI00365AC37E
MAATTATRFRKYTIAGIATAGAAAAAATLAPTPAHAGEPAKGQQTAPVVVSAAHVAKQADATAKQATTTDRVAAIAQDAGHKYPDNLDGWIKQARDIMKLKGIPGSYEGIHRNIIRESGGNPLAQNNWDINAQKGVPSKGLLQVIQPTFDTYHVKGTKDSLTDPVANIVAACNYAADRYGSMDNVNSAY